LINTRLPAGVGIAGNVFQTGKPLIVNDVQTDPRHFRDENVAAMLPTRSLLCVPLTNNGRVTGVLEVINKKDGTPFDEDDRDSLAAFAIQSSIALENARLYSDLKRAFRDTVRVIANAIEARDPYTAGHAERVTAVAIETAHEMGWSREQIELLEIGSLLHDIGKIGVSDAILRKPDRLTDEEYGQMKKHPVVGAKMLESVSILRSVLPYILYHQERYDGLGYPFGLSGKEIPIEGRILAVLDTLDAMTSDRPYRKGQTVEQALAEIKRHRGTQFDPEIVDALLRVAERISLQSLLMPSSVSL
jgi:putative nucleotidyltransferase with HDIG domain